MKRLERVATLLCVVFFGCTGFPPPGETDDSAAQPLPPHLHGDFARVDGVAVPLSLFERSCFVLADSVALQSAVDATIVRLASGVELTANVSDDDLLDVLAGIEPHIVINNEAVEAFYRQYPIRFELDEAIDAVEVTPPENSTGQSGPTARAGIRLVERPFLGIPHSPPPTPPVVTDALTGLTAATTSPAVWAAIVNLKPGERSAPVVDDQGVRVLEVVAHRPRRTQSFEEVREQLTRDLTATVWAARRFGKLNVLRALATVEVLSQPQCPPFFPTGDPKDGRFTPLGGLAP